jgi:hypothetical protein
MAKLDRLVWAAGFAFEAYGLSIGIRVSDPAVLADVRGTLPYGSREVDDPAVDHVYSYLVGGTSGRSRRLHLIYSGVLRIVRTPELAIALHALENDLSRFVGEQGKGHIFVHAGVIGHDGGAIVMPGRSFSGKSTLVAALLAAGATYYSDEFAVFDDRGHVHPFARPISLRKDRESIGEPVAPEALGAEVGTEPLPVRTILFTSYRDGARFRPARLSPGRAVLGLMANTLCARLKPEEALPVLERAVAGADLLRGIRGDAAALVPRLLATRPAKLPADGGP